MKKFIINLEEVVSGSFQIDADDIKSAYEQFVNGYNNCVYINSPGYLVDKRIKIIDVSTDEKTEWRQI